MTYVNRKKKSFSPPTDIQLRRFCDLVAKEGEEARSEQV